MFKIKNTDAIWIYGKHAVIAAIKNPNRKVLKLFLLKQNENLVNKLSVKFEIVDKNFFANKFGKNVVHQGIAALVKPLKHIFLENLNNDTPLIVLDRVVDPQNVGSIMRASAVFGAKAIILPEVNSPDLNATVIKIASGAAEIIPIIRVKNIVQTLKTLQKKGYWCIGLDEHANKYLHELNLKDKLVIVIGSEGMGLRRLTYEHCDFITKLPSYNEFTTLNASQAATISLYEVLKQKVG